ncbi:hypothetical protein EVAR_10897_1 [Eumeta japonica]|uniref:Uncharacterized protein n=1 Tax=Eumeta variegata TaxID=151549 RepID=A0A4C1URJ3_EUMVA|nr:hypothetical protein EVAR_10897_1 [Eumeta japonica]
MNAFSKKETSPRPLPLIDRPPLDNLFPPKRPITPLMLRVFKVLLSSHSLPTDKGDAPLTSRRSLLLSKNGQPCSEPEIKGLSDVKGHDRTFVYPVVIEGR